MVRHERTEVRCCTSPTGESPVPVSAGAPGSRSWARGEIRESQAGCRKPLRREQQRGPQHQVKPAASIDSQWESRAAHFTAKAKPDAQQSGQESASSLSGVGGAARVEGEVRNMGDPSAQPQSRRSVSYKPKAKLSVAQRESEGMVVPVMDVTNNASGGKRPCFGLVEGGGKREGMTGHMRRSNHPSRTAAVKALRLQKRLWTTAKRASHERVGRIDTPTLFDQPWRGACTTLLPERPSVSRVLEIGKHGLNGGLAAPYGGKLAGGS
jgi:hypothetical protein